MPTHLACCRNQVRYFSRGEVTPRSAILLIAKPSLSGVTRHFQQYGTCGVFLEGWKARTLAMVATSSLNKRDVLWQVYTGALVRAMLLCFFKSKPL